MFKYRLVDHGWPKSMECVVIRQSYVRGSERYDYASAAWVRDEECWFRHGVGDNGSDPISELDAGEIIRRASGDPNERKGKAHMQACPCAARR